MTVPDGARQVSVPQVLAVEDNPGDVRLLEEGVATAGTDLEFHVRTDGDQAIDWLVGAGISEAGHLDLLLLDLNLPGRSGFDVLQTVRGDPWFGSVPVVVVSSSDHPEDVRRVYEGSANAYVTKPADPDEYIEMIAAAVRFWIPEVNATDD